MTDDAPICAIATPAGRGGIGVIRVSGRSLTTVINALCGRTLRPRHAHYLGFLDDDGSVIDRGIALHYPAPNSFTGEDVLELQGHGGPVILQLLLRRVLAAGQGIGLRLAEPGEFTRRAYLNEKLDLAQAEAVADLIDASTEQAARSAMRSLSGVFSDRIHALVERVINLRMLVEATLDFPEEEIDFLEAAQARPKLAAIRDDLAALRRTAHQGALLRDGLNVVLAGAPNVGKSSLLNALAGAEVAIVTPIAGTTRDRVTQAIQIDGVPLNIIDTAGLRETVDEVERIGIERTWDALEKADVVVLLQAEEAGVGSAGRGADHAVGAGPDSALDSASDAQRSGGGSSSADPAPSSLDQDIAQRVPAGTPVVVVRNKIDLLADGHARRDDRTVWLSARRGDGVELLRELLLELAGWQPGGESLFIARERHLVAIDAAAVHLGSAAEWAALGNAHLDLFAEELRLAQEQLNAVTGEFTADDLLGVIFSRFCIGK